MSGSSRNCVLLVNPTSGKGKYAALAPQVADRLRAGGLDVTVEQGRDAADADAIARRHVSSGLDALVVMGGDGMVHLALQAVARSATTLGIIPTGTGNDVARYLDIPRGRPLDAAAIVVAGQTRAIDLGRAAGRDFATVLATGFDSRVNERANTMRWPRGQARYNLATLAELGVFKPLHYTVEFDGVREQREAMLIAVGNGPSYGGGLRICEGAELDDGMLDVVVIRPLSKAGLLRVFPRLYNGSHVTHPAYEHVRVRKAMIAASGIVAYADGERIGALPITVEASPSALSVYVPAMTAESGVRPADAAVLDDFRKLYDFPLDTFQLQACEALIDGRGVLVAAPTGSGKTVVGEFAVHLALAQGGKCFYTTPIKALSNQKFADLVDRYGPDRVGLLTGDNSINGEAPIVVMTTEVLRNMLYAGSSTLETLRFVVMDEVHYLADRSRGAVWEEVIIHLPESVSVVSLSATVSNAEEFGEWLATVRGTVDVIVEERRPVPLFQHVMVGSRLYDLFADTATIHDADAVNPRLAQIARDDWRQQRTRDYKGKRGRYRRPGGRDLIPSRVDTVDRLDAEGLLPAIVFIFSRKGCDAAVQQCLNANLRLTDSDERATIRAFAEQRAAALSADDLDVLGYGDWLEALSRGISAHHAGMLPVFKECVEELFARGLVKVVFATETLALGINMPARSVVIDKLTKWNGETHADMTAGEYTQLTGRAGRRGIDVEGHAVVLWSPGFEPKTVAGLASTRTYPLKSSFRPSYNMAVNLVGQVGRDTARALLESSFAQFQADRAVVGLARQARKAEEALSGYTDAFTCDRGDFMEYAELRRALSDREASLSKRRRAESRDAATESLDKLRIGDVIEVPSGKWAGLAVVLDPGIRSLREGPRPLVLTAERQARRLSMLDFPRPVQALTRLRISKNFNPRNPQQRRDLAAQLRERTRDLPRAGELSRPGRAVAADDAEIVRLRAAIREHPCHECPDREDHARWAERYLKLRRETDTLRRRIEQRTNTIARQFDRVCDVLTDLGYVDGDTVNPAGEALSRIYSELDLVAAECLRRNVWDGLEAPALAAVLSALVFESRAPDDPQPPRIPGGRVREVLAEMVEIWSELDALERGHALSYLREPDLGFAWAAYRWAGGADLDEILDEVDLAAGDFVRWVKQLLDLMDQVASAAGSSPMRAVVREAATAMRRGVVAYAADVDTG